MKKSVLLSILYLILSCVTPFCRFAFSPVAAVTAQAEETSSYSRYACALASDVYFYAEEKDTSGLFILPYTYYVKVIKDGSPFVYCSYSTDAPPYKTVYGYCLREKLTFVDFVPERPYLYHTVDVTYSLPSSPNIQDSLSEVTVRCAFYGEFKVGSATYLYVCRNDTMGYLPKTQTITYDLNSDCFPPLAENTPAPTEREAEPISGGAIALLLIVFALIFCAAVFFFVSKFKQPAPQTDDPRFIP